MQQYGLQPFGPVPSSRQMAHLKAGKKAFFHFGVNTFTDSEWGDGTEREETFRPNNVDCRQWIRSVKAAGFEIAILTAKHHDGFCLWPSAYTEHSVKNSPYKDGKGDIVREFTDACREYGVRAGIYLSPWDRNAPGWGTDAYNDFYVAQLTELLTQYGPICEVWWDGAGSKDTPYDWGRWAYTVRNYQPDAAMFGSMGASPYVELRWVGNESGYASDPCYPTIDYAALVAEDGKLLGSGVLDGDRFVPAEVDVSTRPGWFYHAGQDDAVKSVEHMVRIWYQSVGRGGMLLMNFPPNRDGVIPERDAENALRAHELVSRMLSVNLAADGVATSPQARCQECEAQNLLVDRDENVFAVADGAQQAEVHIKLPEAKTFNTFVIGEYLPLGVRVSGYRVSAKVDGAWKQLADKQSIGYLWAEYFEAVCSDEIKLELYAYLAPPVLRHFGLHFLEIDPFKQNLGRDCRDLAKGESARVIYQEDGATVEFGGIYPFNTVRFCGSGLWNYRLEAFDGSKFYEIASGTCPEEVETVHLDERVEGSYQLRLVTEQQGGESLNIQVFDLPSE